MKPRVLHVIDHTSMGGAQTVLEQIIHALGDSISFAVAVIGTTGPFSERYAALGVPVFDLGRYISRWSLQPVADLVQLIRCNKYDLVHAHLFKSAILAAGVGAATNCRTILHDHSNVYSPTLTYYISNRIMRWMYLTAYRYALGECGRVIVLTAIMQQLYVQRRSVDPNKIVVIPNAVDIEAIDRAVTTGRARSIRAELGLSADTRLIMMVGRLEKVKDWPTFLQVADQIRHTSRHPCAFLVVGSGSEESQLCRQAATLALDQFFFLGQRDDVYRLLGQADVFLLTSRQESFGLVLLESMAAGCPVVSTRTDGANAILTDRFNGLLANVGDVQGLVDAVNFVLNSNLLRQKMVQCARQTVVERYNIQVMGDSVATLYHEVMSQSHEYP